MAPKKSVRFDTPFDDELDNTSNVTTRNDSREKENVGVGLEVIATALQRKALGSSGSRAFLSKLSFQNRSSPPPFQPSGRGTKQLTKALEQLEQRERNEQLIGTLGAEYVMCYEPLCFAKVTSRQHDSILIQPMHRSTTDQGLLVIGNHVITTKNSTKLDQVEVCLMFAVYR